MEAASVSVSFFRVMCMRQMLVRYLAREEEGSHAPPVVVLSYAFWRSRMGSDRQVIGKTLALDRTPRTIVGVMPQGFDFPRGPQIWMPLQLDESSPGLIVPTRPISTARIVAR